MPFAGSGDRLIAVGWPAHLIRHENKATWSVRHFGEMPDCRDSLYRAAPDDAEARGYREAFCRIDNLGFSESRDLFADSLIVRDRIREHKGLHAELLFPPIGGNTSRFRTDSYGDFVFYPSHLAPVGRQLIAVQAMRHSTSGVRLVVSGSPGSPADEAELRGYVNEHGLEGKVELRLGWLDEQDEADLLARCLAVAHLPLHEDSHGYPLLAASHSAKPILALRDAVDALEFVRDGVEGLVVEPSPESLAAAFDRLYEDRAEALRMGERSAARRDELKISWDRVVPRLLGERP
jgi:glycosyltransferase involved in cell wall biosynthesis